MTTSGSHIDSTYDSTVSAGRGNCAGNQILPTTSCSVLMLLRYPNPMTLKPALNGFITPRILASVPCDRSRYLISPGWTLLSHEVKSVYIIYIPAFLIKDCSLIRGPIISGSP